MSRPELTVIKGGAPSSLSEQKKHFVSSYVTDTRLMGVLTVHAHWTAGMSTPGGGTSFHQFFYIDCEEYGLETYRNIVEGGDENLEYVEQALIGGLGARKIPLTEREFRGLIGYYAGFNISRGLPMPENFDECSFITAPDPELSEDELSVLMKKICGDITSDYQAVNYFLMRCFGNDMPGASYLTSGDVPADLYSGYHQATFCKNVIDAGPVCEDGSASYLCESLVEQHGSYETVISEIVIKDLTVTACRKCSSFAVSTAEAAMMLAKPEFITVYEVLLSDEDMNENIDELTVNLDTIMSTHDSGRMFMAFKKNNDHVGERVFLLSNDVKGVYFLTDFGQLIVSSYSLSDIQFLENKLGRSPLSPYLISTAKYELREPVLFEFIQSGFEDFEEFLDFIKR